MAKVITDPKIIDSILERGVIAEVLPSKESFRDSLLSGRRLRFYLGIDPTSTSLHLSHAKNLMLLEEFRSLGHEVFLVIGDFTARIGDPSGIWQNTRKALSKEEVKNNIAKIKEQIERIVSAKLRFNSSWLDKLKFEDVVSLASNFTVQQMLERDMFKKRLADEKPIHLHEFLYPLMQGYDSAALEVDAEIGGTDQTFNMLAGRTLLKRLKNKEKFVVVVNLMENPKTGELMSKSRGTGVFLDSPPEKMFGEIMSQPDEMSRVMLINNTRLPLEEVERLSLEAEKGGEAARNVKLRLAEEIVSVIHSLETARQARENFVSVFSRGETPSQIEERHAGLNSAPLLDLVIKSGLVKSKTEARRLIEEGAIEIDGQIKKDPHEVIDLKNGVVLRVGKHRFIRLKAD